MVKEISIEAAPQPQALFEYSPDQPYVFEEIIFNASTSTTSVGNITDYIWDFGDGNTTTTTDPIITYSYDLEGNYTVTLTILTSIGQNATTSKLITILPICGPTAEFTWSPLLPRYNQTVTFNASASTPGWNGTTHPPIVYYVWDFGDGNTTTTTDPIINYVYTQDGNYTVTLTVIDVNGDNSTITKTITVTVLIGDINGDGKVDIYDVAYVAKRFGTHEGDPDYDPEADFNGDGKIDIYDVATVAKHFGEGV
jgi:PKD repeat protein